MIPGNLSRDFPRAETIPVDDWLWKFSPWHERHANLYFARVDREIVVVYSTQGSAMIARFRILDNGDYGDMTKTWWFFERELQTNPTEKEKEEKELSDFVQKHLALFERLPVIVPYSSYQKIDYQLIRKPEEIEQERITLQ
ncbi:MAG: hypothetical protein QW331_04185 [Candidatus Woesearchaeota archaeon]